MSGSSVQTESRVLINSIQMDMERLFEKEYFAVQWKMSNEMRLIGLTLKE